MTQKHSFNEDEALSLAERTFSTEIDEQLAEDIIQYATRLHERYQVNQQPTPDVGELIVALEEIIHPVRFMQARLEEGEQLNGMVAVQLTKDPEYLKDIAKAALANYRKQIGV